MVVVIRQYKEKGIPWKEEGCVNLGRECKWRDVVTLRKWGEGGTDYP